MKSNWKNLIFYLAVPLIVGATSAIISGDSMMAYQNLSKPPLSPPGWLFPVVWTILYLLMGFSSYLIFLSEETKETISPAFVAYFLQLGVNFFWSIFFFNLEWYLFAFFWLILLWLLIIITIWRFYQISKPAAYLLIPYLLWVTFAGYLNLAIYLINF